MKGENGKKPFHSIEVVSVVQTYIAPVTNVTDHNAKKEHNLLVTACAHDSRKYCFH